jgi:hypothetical protein
LRKAFPHWHVRATFLVQRLIGPRHSNQLARRSGLTHPPAGVRGLGCPARSLSAHHNAFAHLAAAHRCRPPRFPEFPPAERAVAAPASATCLVRGRRWTACCPERLVVAWACRMPSASPHTHTGSNTRVSPLPPLDNVSGLHVIQAQTALSPSRAAATASTWMATLLVEAVWFPLRRARIWSDALECGKAVPI